MKGPFMWCPIAVVVLYPAIYAPFCEDEDETPVGPPRMFFLMPFPLPSVLRYVIIEAVQYSGPQPSSPPIQGYRGAPSDRIPGHPVS